VINTLASRTVEDGFSCHSIGHKIAEAAIDNGGQANFLVADAVPPNRSPRVEFPANRENSREFLPFFDDFRENGR